MCKCQLSVSFILHICWVWRSDENLALVWNDHCCTSSWKDVKKCSDIHKSFDCQGWLDALVRQSSVYYFFVAESVIRLYVLSRKRCNRGKISSLEILQMIFRALTCLACFVNGWNHNRTWNVKVVMKLQSIFLISRSLVCQMPLKRDQTLQINHKALFQV